MALQFTKTYVQQDWASGDFLREEQIDGISASCYKVEDFCSNLQKVITINSTSFTLDNSTGLYKATVTHNLNRSVQVIACTNTLKEIVEYGSKIKDLNNIDIYVVDKETVEIVLI